MWTHRLTLGYKTRRPTMPASSYIYIYMHPTCWRCYCHAILCTSIMKHGYIPSVMLDTTLAPIVKAKTGDVTDKNNYRPIAVATPMSKVMELLILSKTECILNTSDNQFGFKKKHGTDMCIHAFRQTIEYYKQNSSPVFICYLDAIKAFDRVNHWLLFKNLLDRNMPLHIVRLLVCWYRTQRFNVQWGGCSSKGAATRYDSPARSLPIDLYMGQS